MVTKKGAPKARKEGKHFNFVISPELHKNLRIQAAIEDARIQDLAERAIAQYIEQAIARDRNHPLRGKDKRSSK